MSQFDPIFVFENADGGAVERMKAFFMGPHRYIWLDAELTRAVASGAPRDPVAVAAARSGDGTMTIAAPPPPVPPATDVVADVAATDSAVALVELSGDEEVHATVLPDPLDAQTQIGAAVADDLSVFSATATDTSLSLRAKIRAIRPEF